MREGESEGHEVRWKQSWIMRASKAVGESLDLIINGSGSHWKV